MRAWLGSGYRRSHDVAEPDGVGPAPDFSAVAAGRRASPWPTRPRSSEHLAHRRLPTSPPSTPSRSQLEGLVDPAVLRAEHP